MWVRQEAWDYMDEKASDGILIGCTLKWIRQTLDDETLTNEEKLRDIRRSMNINKKEIDKFIAEHSDDNG